MSTSAGIRRASEIVNAAIAEGRKSLAEHEVKGLLREAGVKTTEFQYFRELSELDLEGLRYPVALKVSSPRILHKTELGGVILDIGSEKRLIGSVESLKKKFPDEGFIVEPMYSGNVEVIVGVINDPTFGVSLMFGMGGIYTELYKDVTFRVLPIDRDDAEEMLTEIRAAPIFSGFRKIKVDREGMISLLFKISEIGYGIKEHLDQMDLNPVIVSGDGVRVLDAKMILR